VPEEPARLEASDTAYIIFTSGTTGVPKGVMISAGCARNYTTMIAEHLGLRSDDRALETCELSFDFSVHNWTVSTFPLFFKPPTGCWPSPDRSGCIFPLFS
jgi:non-ribosomal peptide synthetase component F